MEFSQVYTVSTEGKTVDYFTNKIFQEINTVPAQCYYIKGNKEMYIKYQVGILEATINSATNIKKLKEIGLEIRLTPTQSERNTVFINSAPNSIFTTTLEELTKRINIENPNIIALSTFVPPPQRHLQKLGSVKITLASQNMTDSILKYGIKIQGCMVQAHNTRQEQYLKLPQCRYCQKFHQLGDCIAHHPVCPHCSEKHRKHECTRINDPLYCHKCKGHHRTYSNLCPKRRELLTEEPIYDFNEESLVCPHRTERSPEINPDPDLRPAPLPQENRWERKNRDNAREAANLIQVPPNQMPNSLLRGPLSFYYDCLKLAMVFKPWYPAF